MLADRDVLRGGGIHRISILPTGRVGLPVFQHLRELANPLAH
jgi:hypothetical protein